MNSYNCKNKWCSGSSGIPATGMNPKIAQCGDLSTMMYQQLETGGLTGRGVTPCPFGYLEKRYDNKVKLYPYEATQFDIDSIFFEPNRPGWLPPQGNPRSLWQIGYTWRNS